MTDITIEHRAEFTDLKEFGQPLQPHDNCVRVYGGNAMGAVIQIRSLSARARGGKKRRMIATASYLDGAKVDQIIAALTEIRKTLP